MRRVIYIPIIHSEIDMGSLSVGLKESYIAKFGKTKWQEYVEAADKLWDKIRKRLDSLKLDYKKVKLYQDGLPKSGRELDIVKELSERGSENYKLILELIDKGAQLIGTEDPGLLIKEYAHVQGVVNKKGEKKTEECGSVLLSARDDYIAKRIKESLHDGEIGILFIGAAHKVDKRLSKDIKIEYLT